MSTSTAQRAPRKRPQATPAALREQAATAKQEATQEAVTALVEASEQEAVQAATEASKGLDVDIVRNRHVVNYRNAEHNAGKSKHAANVAAVAYFRTLPESVTVRDAKSSKAKPVSMRERAEKTLEALCVSVERSGSGKVTRGLDSIGLTVQRVTQLVEAFRNAETALVSLKVESHAEALASEDPTVVAQVEAEAKQVEKLVSALDQARVVSGTKAAEALASSVRETVEEEIAANGADDNAPAPLVVAIDAAKDGVKAMREGKAAQAVTTPNVKTGSQKVADAVQALWDVIETESANLDAGQKSALVGKVQALHAHALKFLS